MRPPESRPDVLVLVFGDPISHGEMSQDKCQSVIGVPVLYIEAPGGGGGGGREGGKREGLVFSTMKGGLYSTVGTCGLW